MAEPNQEKAPRRRPFTDDPEVIARHMEVIRDRVRAYLVEQGDRDPDMDGAMEEVARAMRLEVDGYQIARALEDRGWAADSRLVDVMGDLGSRRYECHREVVRAWVIEQGITPKLAVGDRVTFERGLSKALVEGEITKIDAPNATYVVYVESMGHVRSGQGTYGIILAFEDVQAAQVPQTVEGTP